MITPKFCTFLSSISAALLVSCSATSTWQDTLRAGRLAGQNGDKQSAKKLLQQSVDGARLAHINGIEIANVYLDLAKIDLSAQDDDGARSALDAAIAEGAAAGGKNNEQLIPIYKESAKLFYRKKDFVNSLTAAREALRLERECCEAKSERLLDSLNLVIAASCAQDRCADTAPYLEEQLAIRKEKLGPEHPHVAVSLCLLGEVAEKKGQWKEAQSLYQQALAIRRKVEPQLVAQTEKNLSRVRAHLK